MVAIVQFTQRIAETYRIDIPAKGIFLQPRITCPAMYAFFTDVIDSAIGLDSDKKKPDTNMSG
ncbi:hypothetical protein SOASR015_05240 [Pectobacterium carotovorum subsp. carotovorum]|nr:hypothetical protein SOASR015_05240 [Pectobacterium carotovorum subsp. carotovorum]